MEVVVNHLTFNAKSSGVSYPVWLQGGRPGHLKHVLVVLGMEEGHISLSTWFGLSC